MYAPLVSKVLCSHGFFIALGLKCYDDTCSTGTLEIGDLIVQMSTEGTYGSCGGLFPSSAESSS